MWLLLVGILALVYWLWKPFYWKGKGVKYLVPYPLIGNSMGLITKGNSTFRRDLYYAFPDEKMFGFHLFTQPILCIRDPEIAVDVFVKDFEHFTANGLGSNQEYDLSGGNILFLHGTQWKEMRNKISPFFTPAKVKAMMNSIDVTMPKAVKILEENLRAGSACDIGNLFTRMTNDVITQACFGIESDAFEKNSAFLPLADLFFSPHTNVMFTIKAVSQSLFKFLRLQSFDLDSSLFLKRIMKNLVEYRKENNVQGHDFVQGIIEILDKEHRTVDEERMKKIEYYPDGTRVPSKLRLLFKWVTDLSRVYFIRNTQCLIPNFGMSTKLLTLSD